MHAARWWSRSGSSFNSQTAQHIFYFKLDQNGTQTAVPSQKMAYYTLWHGGRKKETEVGVVKGHFVILSCTLCISGCRCTSILDNVKRNWNSRVCSLQSLQQSLTQFVPTVALSQVIATHGSRGNWKLLGAIFHKECASSQSVLGTKEFNQFNPVPSGLFDASWPMCQKAVQCLLNLHVQMWITSPNSHPSPVRTEACRDYSYTSPLNACKRPHLHSTFT